MKNRLREEIPEEEVEKELVVDEKPARETTENFFTQLFTKGIVTTDSATRALPFILFLAFLGMVYIGNRHLAEKNIRLIDKLGKEVKELNYDYKTAKAELAYKSTFTEIVKRVDTLGLKSTVEPPQKLTVEDKDNEHQN